MEHKIAEAFRPIRAEEALKARTLENVLEAAARRRRLRVKRLSLCAAAGCSPSPRRSSDGVFLSP